MIKWLAIAQARQLGIPDEQIEKIAASLDGLEVAFRPLIQTIPLQDEPAVILSIGAVNQ